MRRRSVSLTANVTEVFVFEKEGIKIPLRGWLDHAFQQGVSIGFDDGHFLKARDGRKFAVSGSASAIRDDENINTGWVIIFRDVFGSTRSQEREKAD